MADNNITINPWVKYTYTIFLVILIPVYWHAFGPGHFLWFSDVALIAMGLELWLVTGMITSMIAVGTLVFELGWNAIFIYECFTGGHHSKLVCNILTPGYPILLRILPLFHVFLPIVIIWMLNKVGYDKRAVWCQSALGTIVLTLVFLTTNPTQNIDWVFAFSSIAQSTLSPKIHFLITLIACLGLYQLFHFMLCKLTLCSPTMRLSIKYRNG